MSQSHLFNYQDKFNAKYFLTANAKRSFEGITGQSLVIFTNNTPVQNLGPAPLKLKKILDMAPITVTDSTPMETVVDMFRKLGLRQTLVTHNGWVRRLTSDWSHELNQSFLLLTAVCLASSPKKTSWGTWKRWTMKIRARFYLIKLTNWNSFLSFIFFFSLSWDNKSKRACNW